MRKKAFTLAEVLITLTIVGIVAIMVIPALMKDIATKSRMTMLRSTVTSLDQAVSLEMSSSQTRNIKSTNIYKNPAQFLNSRMDTTGVTDKSKLFANTYRDLEGNDISGDFLPSDSNVAVALKNGVSIGIGSLISNSDGELLPVYIDVNGQDDPNMAGADFYTLFIHMSDDFSKGVHMGDIGSDVNACESYENKCKAGDSSCCYRWAEISGFDSDYNNK